MEDFGGDVAIVALCDGDAFVTGQGQRMSTRIQGMPRAAHLSPYPSSSDKTNVLHAGPAPQVRLHGFNRTTFYN